MILELLLFSAVFFIFGFITDRFDHFLDEVGRAPLSLLLLFIVSFFLAAALAYARFPFEFVGALLGLLLASKIDRLPYSISIIVILYFLLSYGLSGYSMAILLAFALVSFSDELPYFVSMNRPLLKAFVLLYSVVLGNIPLLFSMLSFDLGYELSSTQLSNR